MPWPDWKTVEHVSWVVTILTILLVLAGVFQLWLVLRELRKKAKIKMGLIVPEKLRRPDTFVPQRTIAAPWTLGAWQSSRIKIPFGIANSGDRSAEDLYHELIFPMDIYSVSAAEGEGQTYRDGSGVHIVWGPDHLHPRSGLTHYVFLHVPRNTTEATVASRAVFKDSKLLETTLNLAFQQRM